MVGTFWDAAYEPTTLQGLYEEKEEIEGFIEAFKDDPAIPMATRQALVNECYEDLDRVKREILNWEGS